MYGGLPPGAAGPGCGCCLPCRWRCCGGSQLGVRKELISSSTYHHFANVQGTLALFAGPLAPVVCVLPWRIVKSAASLVVFWLTKWPISVDFMLNPSPAPQEEFLLCNRHYLQRHLAMTVQNTSKSFAVAFTEGPEDMLHTYLSMSICFLRNIKRKEGDVILHHCSHTF